MKSLKMFNPNQTLLKKLFFGFSLLLLHIHSYSQEETVIDNKGNIITVRNNVVTTSATAPAVTLTSPVENDVWFDTTTNLTKIYDGTNWLTINAGPIRVFGKIASDGTVIKATTGVSVTQLAGNGHYLVSFPATAVTDDDYIIQLSQPGRNGAGNDDPGISYFNQGASSFEVIVGDNDNGGGDRARFNSEFMFTILDL